MTKRKTMMYELKTEDAETSKTEHMFRCTKISDIEQRDFLRFAFSHLLRLSQFTRKYYIAIKKARENRYTWSDTISTNQRES